MANVFYNFLDNKENPTKEDRQQAYTNMVEFLSKLLQVQAEVLPATTDKADIKAVLEDGRVLDGQDRISNREYESPIVEF